MTILYRQVLNGTTFLRTTATPDGSIDAPEGSIVYDTVAAKRYKKVGTSWEEISPLTPLTPSNVPLHASKHIHGAADEIDGDRLDVDFTPANYTATATGTGITGVTSTQHLTAHLKGIDNVLGSGIVGDKGDKGDKGDPGLGGLPVLNVLTDLAGLLDHNGDIFLDRDGNPLVNAQFDVQSGGDAIQGAIDYFITYPGKYHAIYIPALGIYSISKPLIITKVKPDDYAFIGCELLGSKTLFPRGGGKMGGTIIRWNTGNNSRGVRCGTDQPMLIIQGARRVSVQGIEFMGPNLAPSKFHEDWYNGMYKYTWEEFNDPDIRDNPFSPQCAVAIDPFMNASPGGLESNMYPGLEKYYNFGKPKMVVVDGVEVETADGTYQTSSSQIRFDECAFVMNSFGIAVCPAGPTGSIDLSLGDEWNDRGQFIAPKWISAHDKTANCESLTFNNCDWNINRVAYSVGQTQARDCIIHNSNISTGYIGIDTELLAPGGSKGVPPYFSGYKNWGFLKYLFNIDLFAIQGFQVSDMYCEWIGSIGKINFGGGSQHSHAKFTRCDFQISPAAQTGAQVEGSLGNLAGENPPGLNKGIYPEAPFTLWQKGGVVEFDNCGIWSMGNSFLKFYNPRLLDDQSQGKLKFTNTHFSMGDLNTVNGVTKARLGFAHPWDVEMQDVKITGTSGKFIYIAESGKLSLPQSQCISKLILGWYTITKTDEHGRNGSFEIAASTLSSKKLKYYPDLLKPYIVRQEMVDGQKIDVHEPNTIEIDDPDIDVDDMVGILFEVAEGYYPELRVAIPHPTGKGSPLNTMSHFQFGYRGPIGVITSIEDKPGDSTKKIINLSHLPQGFTFGVPMPLTVSRTGWNTANNTKRVLPTPGYQDVSKTPQEI